MNFNSVITHNQLAQMMAVCLAEQLEKLSVKVTHLLPAKSEDDSDYNTYVACSFTDKELRLATTSVVPEHDQHSAFIRRYLEPIAVVIASQIARLGNEFTSRIPEYKLSDEHGHQVIKTERNICVALVQYFDIAKQENRYQLHFLGSK